SNYQIGLIRLEIRWRIVKRQMAIFTDAHERDVHRGGFQLATDHANYVRWILLTIQQMVPTYPCFLNESFHQVFAKAGRVRRGNSYVLVQMEHFDALPIDPRNRCE